MILCKKLLQISLLNIVHLQLLIQVTRIICRVKVGDFENISGYTMAMYTDFTHLDGPLLFIGEQYVVEVDECDEVASYYAGYARVFIDWNHDGEYQVPEEVVLESYYPNTSYNTLVDFVYGTYRMHI